MDTKWRKFSRSGGFKALLLLIVLGCAAAVGAITGYIPESNYYSRNLAMDVLTCSRFEESQTYSLEIRNMIYQAKDAYENYYKTGKKIDLDYYYDIRTRTLNFKSKNENYCVSFYIDEDGRIASDDSLIPSAFQYSNFEVDDGVSYTVGITETRYDYLCTNWYITQRNMRIILISDGVLLLIAAAAFIMLIRVAGEKADGTVTFPGFFRLWFEPSVAILCMYTLLISAMSRTDPRNMIYSSYYTTQVGFVNSVNSYLSLALYGACLMGFAGLLTYVAVSLSIRVKNKNTVKGFLVYWVFLYVWKALRAVGRALLAVWKAIREFFTGELYKTDRAAKKFIFLDAVFIGTSLLLFALFLIAKTSYIDGLAVFWAVVWVIALGLFIYGRYLVTRDEAKLEQQIREIAGGNYAYDPELSKNSPYTASCEALSRLADGYRRGIEEGVKAERTKIELITNVSHDLKTPLTSIISYIDLLSREQLSPQAAEYVAVLQQKSERLKHIVSDVFELAKTTSGEITVQQERIDLTRLANQSLAEMEDKIQSAGLAVKTAICEPPVEVISDGKRLYRVIQNLMDNALKYSMKGTRIYFTLEKNDRTAVLTIKNIAAYEMDFTKEEILERFARGDKARTTEGSGLGLSIAQGFTIACGGRFDIDIDGDMFKVMLEFPLAAPAEEKAAVTADA